MILAVRQTLRTVCITRSIDKTEKLNLIAKEGAVAM